MNETGLLAQAKQLVEAGSQKAQEASGFLESARQLILDNFGQNGLYAAYILAAVLAVVIVMKLIRLTFSVLTMVVLPGIALAFVVSLLTPYNFAGLLPVTVTGCSLFLLFKA